MRASPVLQRGLIVLVGLLLPWPVPADEPAKKGAVAKPPWQRHLQSEDARKAAGQEKQLAHLQEAARFPEALQVAEALAGLRSKEQGADHWQAVDARIEVDALRRVLRQTEQGQKDHARSLELLRRATELLNRGRYTEAQPLLENVLAIRRKALGEEHPRTATSYNYLALNQQYQGKYAAAEEGYKKTLAIWRKALGEEHPDTATAYNNLAGNQYTQGKYAQAEELHRKALAIRLEVLGAEHPDTAQSYNNLALNQNKQGKYAAAEKGYKKALAIRLEVLGPEHPDTAVTYLNVAANLASQGKYREAEESGRRALAIWRKVLGEEHPLKPPTPTTTWHSTRMRRVGIPRRKPCGCTPPAPSPGHACASPPLDWTAPPSPASARPCSPWPPCWRVTASRSRPGSTSRRAWPAAPGTTCPLACAAPPPNRPPWPSSAIASIASTSLSRRSSPARKTAPSTASAATTC